MDSNSKTNVFVANKTPTGLPIKRCIQRKTPKYFRRSEPKIGGGKIASNLARLKTRNTPKAFNVSFAQEQLTTHLTENYKTCKYRNLAQLLDAARKHVLLQGQLILEMVDISHHKTAAMRNTQYNGWISQSVASVESNHEPYFNHSSEEQKYYIHVAVYVGEFEGKQYVVDAGGRNSFIPMMFGMIGLRRFCMAFHERSSFYVFTPIIENQCSFNHNLILQRAFGGIGTKYLYHAPGLVSEVFMNVLLGGITEDTFTPIWHNRSVSSKNQDISNAKYFHGELTSQIRQVRQGIHLSLGCYITCKNKNEKPWFRPFLRSFVDLMSFIKLNDGDKCREIIDTSGLTLSSYNSDGETPLTFAARQGSTSICTQLVDFTLGADLKMALSADVNLPDANDNTALLQAFLNVHLDTCDTLIALGANAKDLRFQKILCDSFSKWYSPNKLVQCKDLAQHFKNIICIEVFYNHLMLEAIKDGNQSEYIKHMDNFYGTHSINVLDE
jgi:hypothetical protein